MSEEAKIETKPQSFRLPVDVIDTLQRWATDTGQSMAACITTCVRVAAEDEKRITRAPESGESVLQDGEDGASVIHLRTPTTRDALADALSLVLRETEDRIGERDQISALGVARARVYKGTTEFQEVQSLRDAGKLPPSGYADEKRLAERLSSQGGATKQGMREKGER